MRPFKVPRKRRSARAEQAEFNAIGRAFAKDMSALDAADQRLAGANPSDEVLAVLADETALAEKLGVTPVIFRKYPNSRGGEVVALFPEEPASEDGRTCSCYVHVGQHGEADPSHVVATTRPATPEEY